ncbi:MAG TPA: hypothetical protein VLH16_02960, partial [Bacteroidales bacterium]|nr:hypothetical protein [Bacteroidales bacterium]
QEFMISKPYSDKTAELIDKEVGKLIALAYKRALSILQSHKEQLEKLAELLLKSEVIFREDVEQIFGKRPFPDYIPAAATSNNDSGKPDENSSNPPATAQSNASGDEPTDKELTNNPL